MIAFLGELANFLKENPPVATVIASVIALTGTIIAINLSNRANTKRLYKQFEEDRKKEDAKRRFESRRDIYLNAADAVATAALCLGRLSDIERPASEIIAPFLEKAGQIAKVHIVASPATSKLTAELTSTIVQAVTALTFARIPLEVERRRLNESKPDNVDEEAEKRRKEIDLLRVLITFGDMCLANSISVAGLSAKAIALIRADLGIDIGAPYEPPLGETATRGRIAYRQTTDAFLQEIKETPMQWHPPTPTPSPSPPPDAGASATLPSSRIH